MGFLQLSFISTGRLCRLGSRPCPLATPGLEGNQGTSEPVVFACTFKPPSPLPPDLFLTPSGHLKISFNWGLHIHTHTHIPRYKPQKFQPTLMANAFPLPRCRGTSVPRPSRRQALRIEPLGMSGPSQPCCGHSGPAPPTPPHVRHIEELGIQQRNVGGPSAGPSRTRRSSDRASHTGM